MLRQGCHDGPSPGALPDHGPQTEGPGPQKVLRRDSMAFASEEISLDFNAMKYSDVSCMVSIFWQ